MAFNTRYLDEYRTEIRLDIGCPGGGGLLWQDTELDRCVQRAVDDLTRHYPDEVVYEHTIVLDPSILPDYIVAPAAGTWKDLTYKPIKPGSDTVTSSPAGTTYTRDTDYTIDYRNGRITIVAAALGGTITEGAPLLVDYTKSRIGIDISAIITDLIRISRVEYPVDRVPQQFVSYNIFGDFLYIGSQKPGESQTQIADKEHVAIYYEKPQSAPTGTSSSGTAPSYPAFLDQVICVGAGAYAFLMKAVNTEHQVVVDLAAVRTALGNVATYLGTTGDAYSAVGILADITDNADDLRTDIIVALNAARSALYEVDTTDLGKTDTGAEALLSSGSAYINTVNVGDRVPENYREYAQAATNIATVRTNSALGLIQEATIRLSTLRSYIEEAGGWNRVVEDYISEAQSRLGVISDSLGIADRFRTEGVLRRDEFWTILKDRTEWRRRISSAPVTQPAGGPVKATAKARTDQL